MPHTIHVFPVIDASPDNVWGAYTPMQLEDGALYPTYDDDYNAMVLFHRAKARRVGYGLDA